MVKVSASKAKIGLPALMAGAAAGLRVVIESRGRPVAALVSLDDLAVIERERPTSTQPKGALVLIGAWSEVDDHDADALLEEIYARRSEDTGRPVLTASEPRTDTAC